MTMSAQMDSTKLAENAEKASAALRSLANPSRLMLLCQLVDGEKTVGEMEDALGLGQAYVSQQLARLRDDGLVSATRDGRQMRYQLADPRVTPVIEVLYQQYCK